MAIGNQNTYLAHYGIKGQKLGYRRFQNKDGSLTAEGKARARAEYKGDRKDAFEKGKAATVSRKAHDISVKQLEKAKKKYYRNMSERNAQKVKDAKKS